MSRLIYKTTHVIGRFHVLQKVDIRTHERSEEQGKQEIMDISKAKRVAVIGAGISGVATAAHLKNAGIDVTVFERNRESGGCWIYDERIPIEPTYPAIKPSVADSIYVDSKEANFDKLALRDLQHAPPGPCYVGLKNNVATRLMKTTLNDWPSGTPDYVSHHVLKDYIQETSRINGVDALTIYGARVVDLIKGPTDKQWDLRFTTLRRDSLNSKVEEQERSLKFDHVVIASGHYHSPRIPDIPGLKEWKQRWPSRVWHSKSYRKPDEFRGKNVLLVGAGTSSTDIARELGPLAKNVYQSHRNGKFDHPASMLPENAIRVSEVQSFDLNDHEETSGSQPSNSEPTGSTITLKSGERLCNIDYVILCSGYHVALPFLRRLHEDDTLPSEASETVLVTNGEQLHNLHKDIAYIPDPTLLFVGVPYFTATFTLFEFQAIVVAQVLSGKADWPDEQAMREEYRQRVIHKGFGKPFHSLRGVEVDYVNELLGWVNAQGEARGAKRIEGHTEEWHQAKAEFNERLKKIFEGTGIVAEPIALPSC
ncbi:pantothenate transporter [Venturia nashicola]|uniref:Pantothenate transporter n=1 Tax=Venturia nashicola TaxID=86259 RepID=A0A4Z1P0V0_9PEZI|nr:pantothenate transporter [Venturia nashicola]